MNAATDPLPAVAAAPPPASAAPHGTRAARRPVLLLIESNFMLRRTVALTAQDLDVSEIHEATSIEAAARLLATEPCDAILIALDDGNAGIELIEQVRNGTTACAPGVPVAVMADSYDQARMQVLLGLCIARALLKPTKIKSIVQTVAFLSRATPAPAH